MTAFDMGAYKCLCYRILSPVAYWDVLLHIQHLRFLTGFASMLDLIS